MEIILKITLNADDAAEDVKRNIPIELRHVVDECVTAWSPVRARVELVEDEA